MLLFYAVEANECFVLGEITSTCDIVKVASIRLVYELAILVHKIESNDSNFTAILLFIRYLLNLSVWRKVQGEWTVDKIETLREKR